MSSEEIKLKRSQSRKRNYLARILKDPSDHRGAFKMKIRDERKGVYQRIRMKVTEVNDDDET